MECHQDPTSNHRHWLCFKQWESSRVERSHFRPRRLLELYGDNVKEDSIRLIAGEDVPIEQHYVALSYCW
jgi:hypothetical protein